MVRKRELCYRSQWTLLMRNTDYQRSRAGIIDMNTWKVARTFSVRGGRARLYFDDSSQLLYVSQSGSSESFTWTVVDTRAHKVFTSIFLFGKDCALSFDHRFAVPSCVLICCVDC